MVFRVLRGQIQTLTVTGVALWGSLGCRAGVSTQAGLCGASLELMTVEQTAGEKKEECRVLQTRF